MIGHIADDVLPRLGPHHHPPEHPVPLRRARAGPRGACATSASVGLTTREACGDTVRNVHGLPPRRRLPVRGARHHAVGRGRLPALPAQPARPAPAPQVQDQLLRLRHRLRPGDVQRRRRHRHHPHARRRHRRARLPGVRRRRPRRQPAPGAGPRGVHRPRGPAADASRRSCGCSTRRQPRQQAAGPHEVARRHARLRRGAAPRPQGAPVPARLVVLAGRHPRGRRRSTATRRPASHAGVTPTADRPGHAGRAPRARDPYERWERGQRRARRRQGHGVGRTPTPRLGDITSDQFRALASIQRELGAEVRVTNRQNLVFRGLTEEQLPTLFDRLEAIGMAEPGAELARDVVACPGADTCNLAVTQSRGLADAIGAAPRGGGPGRGRRRPHQHLRLHELAAASTTSPTSASSAPSAGPTASRRPATRCCSAATSARSRSTSARRRCACRPRTRPRPPCGSCAGSPTSARPARRSARGSTASGGAKAIADDLKDLDEFPTPEEAPEYYVDYGETGPVRRRDRRVGVRDMMLEPNPLATPAAVHRRGAGRAQPRVRAPARRRRSSSGRSTTSRPHLA